MIENLSFFTELKNTLFTKRVRPSEATQTLYGLGGAFPYIHAATLTPTGVISYGGRLISPEVFMRYTNMIQVMGSSQIP